MLKNLFAFKRKEDGAMKLTKIRSIPCMTLFPVGFSLMTVDLTILVSADADSKYYLLKAAAQARLISSKVKSALKNGDSVALDVLLAGSNAEVFCKYRYAFLQSSEKYIYPEEMIPPGRVMSFSDPLAKKHRAPGSFMKPPNEG